MFARQPLNFGSRHLMDAAAFIERAMPQADGNDATWLQQRDEFAERPIAFGWQDMHPHAAEQDHVEGRTKSESVAKGWQGVGDPANWRIRVQTLAFGAHRSRWLKGNDLESERREPCGIAPAAGSDIEDGCRRLRQEVGEPGVQGLWRYRVIALRHFRSMCIVPSDGG